MCGFVGYINFSKKNGRSEGDLRIANETIKHRGPDEGGYFQDDFVGFGHQRLSIIDIDSGRQPIFNEDGSIVVIFNGELFNYQKLREELISKGHKFKTNGDTETIVHLYEEKGKDFVHYLEGMFSLAIYDIQKKEVILARDRYGIKPLYFHQDNNGIIAFASEIKAILKINTVDLELDTFYTKEFLFNRFVKHPNTVYKGIKKLSPGSISVINSKGHHKSFYYNIENKKQNDSIKEQDKYSTYKTKLNDAVKSWMIADVPVGSFLSGGLDSSVLTALMQQYSPHKVKSFTISFPGHVKDESLHASKVAKYLNTDHHVFTINQNEPEKLSEIFYHLEEPINDPAIIPTYFLSEETKKEVKVVMSGEGSDEINLGYNKYKNLNKLVKSRKVIPAIRQVVNSIGNIKLPVYGKAMSLDSANAIEKWNFLFASVQNEEFRKELNGDEAFLNKKILNNILENISPETINQTSFIIQKYDMESWLTNDLLLKVDKMSMAHGLEARTPYLDREFVEYCLALDYKDKIYKGDTKYMLRKYAGELLPKVIQERKQHGFIFPLDGYFSNLSNYVNDVLIKNESELLKHIDPSLYNRLISSDKINKLKWGCFTLIMCLNALRE